MDKNKYGSRKFIVTVLTILCTTILAGFKLVNGDIFLIFSAAIASYNIVNGWITKNNG